ncbi:MAG: exodeoxyribonuclease I [Lysobacteraceae bacterium]
MSDSFLWYDLETFGRDPRRTRIAQFAALRTDAALNVIGEPERFSVRPALDLLPSPTASLITGLSPLDLLRDGLREVEAIERIARCFGEPGTCGVGWNTLRFDDEFLRHGFYRHFHDPYRREYQDGNSRWDLLDHARFVHALRPDGIHWPRREDGAPSFRLEHLAAANDIAHGHAHDALSDVEATLGMARLFRAAQPRLWDYHLGFRSKARARQLVDPARPQPLLHVSGRFPAHRGCAALVLPLAEHPRIGNQIIVCDLSEDPAPLLEQSAEDIAERLFAPADALPEGESRAALKAVHLNRSPALVALAHVRDAELERLGIDRAQCLATAARLSADSDLAERVRRVFALTAGTEGAQRHNDVDQALYDALPDRRDTRTCLRLRSLPPQSLASLSGQFHDSRSEELLFRLRARNWPETLDADEQARWRDYRESRLACDSGLSEYSFDSFDAELAALAAQQPSDPARDRLLDDLRRWGAYLRGYP